MPTTDLSSLFDSFDREKAVMAQEELAKREAAKEEQSAKVKKASPLANRFRDRSDDELTVFTEEEVELMSADESGYDNLTFGTDGTIIRLSDQVEIAEIPEEPEPEPELEVDWPEELEEVPIEKTPEEVSKEMEDSRRKEALRNALRKKHSSDELDELPEIDIEIQEVETLSMGEAKLYIAINGNAETNEMAYGFYLERGSGLNKLMDVGGSRYIGASETAVGFLAAGLALNYIVSAPNDCKEVTLYAKKSIGWELHENAWEVKEETQCKSEAEYYSQAFVACSNLGITIRIVFEEPSDYGFQFASNIAEAMVI